MIGGRWSLQILRQLSKGFSRPVALLGAVNSAAGEGRKLSEKIMFETLARLAADGIISRERVAGYPPETHYWLTDSGRGILNAISRLGRSGRAADDGGSGAAEPRGHDAACACACARCGVTSSAARTTTPLRMRTRSEVRAVRRQSFLCADTVDDLMQCFQGAR